MDKCYYVNDQNISIIYKTIKRNCLGKTKYMMACIEQIKNKLYDLVEVEHSDSPFRLEGRTRRCT